MVVSYFLIYGCGGNHQIKRHGVWGVLPARKQEMNKEFAH